MAKKEPTATTTVALIANRTLQVSSNRRLAQKRRPWWPQHRAGGHDDAGAPGQALASWDRGRHPRDTSTFPISCLCACRLFPDVYPNSHSYADKREGPQAPLLVDSCGRRRDVPQDRRGTLEGSKMSLGSDQAAWRSCGRTYRCQINVIRRIAP